MKKNSSGHGLAVFLGILVVLYVIGTSEPKCIKDGCDNNQASGSSYCYLHKPYTGSGTSHSSSSYSNHSSGSTYNSSTGSYGSSGGYSNKSNSTNTSYSSGTWKSTTTKNRTYGSYDDGYDDVYLDGDYDYDRYDWDRDYAEGVDDAMDEYGEDW